MQTILKLLLSHLIDLLTPDLIKKGIDSFLDAIEQGVKNSDTTIDDVVLIPVIHMIRTALNIPQDVPIEKK